MCIVVATRHQKRCSRSVLASALPASGKSQSMTGDDAPLRHLSITHNQTTGPAAMQVHHGSHTAHGGCTSLLEGGEGGW